MNYTKINLYGYFYNLVKQIPDDKITTYGALANALGDIKASRAVGYMLSVNKDPDIIPCYKVVHTDKTTGKYRLGIDEKIRRLKNDGVEIINGKVTNFDDKFFDNFKTDYPLKKLREEQLKIAEKIDLNDHDYNSNIAAVDVSYENEIGYAAMVYTANNEYSTKTYINSTDFPYIPGYLAYRELPFIEKLSEGFDGIIIIDANGLLHPRKCGLATFAGIIMDKTTIGVAKSLLLGNINNNYIYYNNEKLGYMINKHTIVSPGNKISLGTSIKKIMLLGNGKYPEILKLAHNETVKLRKRRLPS